MLPLLVAGSDVAAVSATGRAVEALSVPGGFGAFSDCGERLGLGPVITSKSNILLLLGVGPGKAALGSTRDQKRESRQLGGGGFRGVL